jgi:3-oxoacyl-[acyl-carrier-protein] synthase II
MSKVTPLWLLKYLPNMPASHIAIYNDLRGPNNSLTYREASANLAIGEAYFTIVRGGADRMIAGATGSCIHPLKTVHVALQTPLANNGGDPRRLSRPFDLHRTGMVLGEGAGAVVLEELEMARARGATIWAEIVGCGSSVTVKPNSVADYDMAIQNAVQMALRAGGLAADRIGHIHAHGLGTQKSDQDEAHAINAIFGDYSGHIPVAAAKSFFGNLGAGGGVAEFICSLLALRHGKLFPVLNYETPDPQCLLRLATDDSAHPGGSVLNISFTMQGQASCVVACKVS